jgi:hypothetical protein
VKIFIKGLMFNYNPYSLTFLNKTPEAKGFDYVNELMDPHSVVEMVKHQSNKVKHISLNPDNQILDILEKNEEKNRLERFIQKYKYSGFKIVKRNPDKIRFNLSLNNNSLALDLLEKIYPN